MKAAVFHTYGGPEVVRVETLADPVPAADEILIRTTVSTVNSGDSRVRALRVPFGFKIFMRLAFGVFRPRKKVLGFSLAGVVEATGSDVTRFSPGDRVVAAMADSFGAHAELVTVKDDSSMALIPDGVSDADAAACIFGGHTALHFLRDLGQMQPGEHLAINGASGAVGSAMIQIGNLMGAEVTAVCSAANAEMVRKLGADHVVDYRETDFAARLNQYDLIADCVGNVPWARANPALKPKGRHLMIFGTMAGMIQGGFVSEKDGKKSLGGAAEDSSAGLAQLMDWLKQGELTPQVDSSFDIEEVQAAHARVDTERKRGSVLLTFGA